jgi:hypothetical protein
VPRETTIALVEAEVVEAEGAEVQKEEEPLL